MKKNKLNILLIAHCFPPLNKIGSLRTFSWAKYWSGMGHRIQVITTKKNALYESLDLQVNPDILKSIDIEEIPYQTLRKMNEKRNQDKGGDQIFKRNNIEPIHKKMSKYFTRNLRILTGINPYGPHLWVLPAVRSALNIYSQRSFDVMVSSYGPSAAHIIAGILKRKLGIFWVADYRDLWYGNHFYAGKWPFSYIEQKIENFFVSKSDLITTVSDPWKEKLYSRFGIETVTIANGFEKEDILPIEHERLFPDDGKMRFIYTGTLYLGKQDPSPLFKAINILRRRGIPVDRKLEIVFYGTYIGKFHELIKTYNMEDIVKTPGFVDYKTSLLAQRNADINIYLDWNDPSHEGVLAGKLFEYMYSGKPILSIGNDSNSSANKLIEKAGIGINAGDSEEKIAGIVEMITGGGKIHYAPSEEVMGEYTRENLAGKMMEEIKKHLKKMP
jgi:glycosyltransferase involved in cell wall biosynthesis